MMSDQLTTCISCGCTDAHACIGGCFWLATDHEAHTGVCSRCPEALDEWRHRVVMQLQRDLAQWSDDTFGRGRTPDGCIAHLAAEVKEVRDHPYDIEEYADCLLLLLDAARLAGYTSAALVAAGFKKLEVCKKRKWGTPNAEGYVEHIHDEDSRP